MNKSSMSALATLVQHSARNSSAQSAKMKIKTIEIVKQEIKISLLADAIIVQVGTRSLQKTQSS